MLNKVKSIFQIKFQKLMKIIILYYNLNNQETVNPMISYKNKCKIFKIVVSNKNKNKIKIKIRIKN